MTDIRPPVPRPTAISESFWDACRRHELLVQTCDDCTHPMSLPQEFCRRCHSRNLSWREASGCGTIYSYTVVWRPQTPAFQTPYVVAIVELEEGNFLMTNIIDCSPDDLYIGMPVFVAFQRRENFELPMFRPAPMLKVVTQ